MQLVHCCLQSRGQGIQQRLLRSRRRRMACSPLCHVLRCQESSPPSLLLEQRFLLVEPKFRHAQQAKLQLPILSVWKSEQESSLPCSAVCVARLPAKAGKSGKLQLWPLPSGNIFRPVPCEKKPQGWTVLTWIHGSGRQRKGASC